MNKSLKKQAGLHTQTGLFAGLLSSNTGTWIPMQQLRRICATGAWALFFGLFGYAAIQGKAVAGLGPLPLAIGGFVFALVSYGAFIVVGVAPFKSERQ